MTEERVSEPETGNRTVETTQSEHREEKNRIMPHLWDNNKRAYYICIIRVTEKRKKRVVLKTYSKKWLKTSQFGKRH